MSHFALGIGTLWYFRNLAPVIELLARRGHRVDLIVGRHERGASGSEEELGRIVGTYPNVKHIQLRRGEKDDRKARWADLDVAVGLALDRLHFRAPVFNEKSFLRERSNAKGEGPLLAAVDRPLFQKEPGRRLGLRVLRRLAEALPPDADLLRLWREKLPDLFVVCPLFDTRKPQFDQLRAARHVGVPSALIVHSWDNLSSKSWLRRAPDTILVWNEMQRKELARFHGMRKANVQVCGAPHYDEWFDRAPTLSREEFHRQLGLSPDEKTIVFVGSAVFQPPLTNHRENDFLEPWLAAIRSSDQPALRRANIILRPHPKRRGELQQLDLSGYERVKIWPPDSENPVSPESRSTYLHTLAHCDAVVGLNTSAFLEAAILGRPVFTVLDPRFDASQRGTFHFDWLLSTAEPPGVVRVAHSYEEHIAALERRLQGDDPIRDEERRFILDFVRPNGAGRSATIAACDALEAAAARPRARMRKRHIWEARILRRFLLDPISGSDLARRQSVKKKMALNGATTLPAEQRLAEMPPTVGAAMRANSDIGAKSERRATKDKRRAMKDKQRA